MLTNRSLCILVGKSKSVAQLKNEATLFDNDDDVYQISSGDEDETTGMKSKYFDNYMRLTAMYI